MRPLSFYTSSDNHDKRISYRLMNDDVYNIWLSEYKNIYSKLGNGEKYFFTIENKTSNKNGFVGYLDDNKDLVNPKNIPTYGDCRRHWNKKVNLKVFDEEYQIPSEWLIDTPDTECSNIKTMPIRKDMFGNIVKTGMYAIWTAGGKLHCGYVCKQSKIGAIYVSEFNDRSEKNIRYPNQELVVFDSKINLMSIFAKMKLRKA